MLILTLLAAAGLSFLIKYKLLPLVIKWTGWISLEEVKNCSLCLGFWSGLIVSPLEFTVESFILIPLASAVITWTIESYVDLLQTITIWIENQT